MLLDTFTQLHFKSKHCTFHSIRLLVITNAPSFLLDVFFFFNVQTYTPMHLTVVQLPTEVSRQTKKTPGQLFCNTIL